MGMCVRDVRGRVDGHVCECVWACVWECVSGMCVSVCMGMCVTVCDYNMTLWKGSNYNYFKSFVIIVSI